ncbi:hypothetical protein EGW08_014059 [Elysia chlorotica]|uniref:Uncharacterized protein n=1 Tax=Elysia chlorotica TaxID=188477 RepID=A0A433T9A5_ELYCH|nr:hypothetical protein EGW08_014059 [Elysia chlorotica]
MEARLDSPCLALPRLASPCLAAGDKTCPVRRKTTGRFPGASIHIELIRIFDTGHSTPCPPRLFCEASYFWKPRCPDVCHLESKCCENTMHQAQTMQSQGQGRNLSATGGVLAFLFGAWVGVAVSRHYEIPSCRFPGGKRRRDSEVESGQEGESSGSHGNRKPSWQSRLPPEVREGIEKIKAFERRYRKPESTGVVGGESDISKEAWTSEWSE